MWDWTFKQHFFKCKFYDFIILQRHCFLHSYMLLRGPLNTFAIGFIGVEALNYLFLYFVCNENCILKTATNFFTTLLHFIGYRIIASHIQKDAFPINAPKGLSWFSGKISLYSCGYTCNHNYPYRQKFIRTDRQTKL